MFSRASALARRHCAAVGCSPPPAAGPPCCRCRWPRALHTVSTPCLAAQTLSCARPPSQLPSTRSHRPAEQPKPHSSAPPHPVPAPWAHLQLVLVPPEAGVPAAEHGVRPAGLQKVRHAGQPRCRAPSTAHGSKVKASQSAGPLGGAVEGKVLELKRREGAGRESLFVRFRRPPPPPSLIRRPPRPVHQCRQAGRAPAPDHLFGCRES